MKRETLDVGAACLNVAAKLSRAAFAAWMLPLGLFLLLPAPTVQGLDFTYTVSGGKVTITGYTGPGGAVTIPATIAGLPVTSIGSSAFQDCTSLTSVAIPGSTASIGAWAFDGCTGLTAATIGSGVTSIGSFAFFGCSNLTSIVIPDSVTDLGIETFYHCIRLSNATIGSRVNTIASSAFEGCTSLASVTIKNGVMGIGSEAFSDCSSLTSVVIPGSITSIGAWAFERCTGLTSATIGGGVTSIGDFAFMDCSNLTSIVIPDSVTDLGVETFYHCIRLSNATIGSGVTSIGNSAFEGCTSLASVTIKNGVMGIGSEAFSDCSSLTSVVIPDSVTSIGMWAFDGCTGLTAATIGSGVTSIGSFAFLDCSNLTGIVIPDSVSDLGTEVFYHCTRLTNATIGSGVTNIGNSAFEGCTSLASVTIKNGVMGIGSEAFSDCSSLTSIVIPNSVTNIGMWAFDGCTGLASATIGSGLTSIGSYAFLDCSNLTGVYFRGNAPNYGSSPFYGANKSTVYYVPGTLGWTNPWAGRPTALWCDYTLTVNSFGAPGVTISSATGYGGITDYQKTGIAPGTSVNLVAPASDPSGYVFSRWTLDAANQPAGQKSLDFAMTGPRTAVAVYDTVTLALTVNSAGASSVTISSSTGHGGTTNYQRTGIAPGASINLNAPAADPPGSVFLCWTLDAVAQASGQKLLGFTMTAPRTAVAVYSAVTCMLTVSASPSTGGTVSGDGTFDFGSWRTVTATASNGYTFANWTENGTVVSSSASYSFALTADRNLVANFAADPSPATDGAQLVGMSPESGTTVAPGTAFTLVVTMRNTGTTTWTGGMYGYTLNRTPQGADPFGQGSTYYATLDQGSVCPGGTGTFTICLTAPTTPGTRTGTWRMSNPAYTLFGDLVTLTRSVVGSVTPEKTPTGFFYPTGRREPYAPGMPGFLAGGRGMPPYREGVYHIGQDMEAAEDDSVYAISDGDIVYVSAGAAAGWGDNNYGLVVRHRLSNGDEFLALYGHVRPNLEVLKYSASSSVSPVISVTAGQAFAKIGPGEGGTQGWDPHLHFGIHPEATIPIPSPYGRIKLNESNWPTGDAVPVTTNGFVDPVDWIKTKAPYAAEGTVSYALSVQTGSGSQASISITDGNGRTISGLTNFTQDYPAGSWVTVTAPSTLGSEHFVKWTLDGNDYSVGLTVTVQMEAAHTLVAVYEAVASPQGSPGCGVAGADNLPILGMVCFLGLMLSRRFVTIPR